MSSSKNHDSKSNGINNDNRIHSPAFSINDDEDDYRDEEEEQQRALLSSTSTVDVRRPSRENGRVHDAAGDRKQTHVSNWQFMRSIFAETLPTLMFALFGTFLTGELLELLATWRAFKAINELLILVPMLLNLKGNLEMNLSARLSTASNMGDLDNRTTRRHLIVGNMSLLQVQGILVSCLAATFSFVISLVLPHDQPEPSPPVGNTGERDLTGLSPKMLLAHAIQHLVTRAHPHRPHPRPTQPTATGPREFLIVLLIGQSAASLSSAILGAFMCALVLLCRYFRLNPDNIAPAVASALGDLLTLALLGISSHFLYPMSLAGLILVQIGYLVLLGFSFWVTKNNPRVKGLLKEGWTPLLCAMVISSGTGMILDSFVGRYKDYGLVSIAQDGIPGSVGSVYISRLSTSLHEAQGHSGHQRGDGHEHSRGALDSPRSFLKPKDEATKRALKDARPRISGLALFLVTVPVQVIFLTVAYASKWLELPALWAAGFVIFFATTVVCSLVLSHYLSVLIWNRDLDPDTYALPIQSSLCDLMGQTFLVTCYEVVGLIGGHRIIEGR
ncbi:SubName: Full=Uncharacterized protein {ECO:0000313/EMBL:CCA66834.1} [Serendipita indica DSM 11827]|nr:SubName: Full=Uncharacterized protein {ECO:0000313/EMBL:CCA66834.1} [Serendipita indica DSM 11827]